MLQNSPTIGLKIEKEQGRGGWNKLIANFSVFDGIRLTSFPPMCCVNVHALNVFFSSLANPPPPPLRSLPSRRLRATQRRVSDAKPRSNPSVYLGFEARPQPLPLLSRGFKANFHLLAPGLRFSIPAPELRIPPPRASVPV